MRRRLREVRSARDGRLLELGALVFELHRHERRDSKLLEAGVARVAALDDEERALATALAIPQGLPALARPSGEAPGRTAESPARAELARPGATGAERVGLERSAGERDTRFAAEPERPTSPKNAAAER